MSVYDNRAARKDREMGSRAQETTPCGGRLVRSRLVTVGSTSRALRFATPGAPCAFWEARLSPGFLWT